MGGAAGAGKTSLLRAFRAELGSDVAVFLASCDPLSAPRPLGPIHDLAGDLDPALASLLPPP